MQDGKLPDNFKPLFWSQDYLTLDLKRDKNTIIINTINYGDLSQWKWIITFYGKELIKETLMKLSCTAFRDRVRPLVRLIFSIPHFNHAPRSTT